MWEGDGHGWEGLAGVISFGKRTLRSRAVKFYIGLLSRADRIPVFLLRARTPPGPIHLLHALTDQQIVPCSWQSFLSLIMNAYEY